MDRVLVHSLWSDYDIYLFKQGKHFDLYKLFGSHKITLEGQSGYYFSVYAPAAKMVSVIGNFNFWDPSTHPLNVRWDGSGIWEGFIPDVQDREAYKFAIQSDLSNGIIEKCDPYARHCETPPHTASITWPMGYSWKDRKWLKKRKKIQSHDQPLSIYEMHLGSWKRNTDNEYMTYTELAEELPKYLYELGFTHVEFLPVMEHPYDLSWGYQSLGYFAPTSRFGTPEEFKFLVDQLHRKNIGVILDWVPSHFPEDAHGLAKFDGSHVYEHPDHKKGYHPDWKSLIFNYERPEIQSFLISSAMFWLSEFHIDGFRVDAVASMLYLDYSREEGGWEPNEYGGKEYLAAIEFLRSLNSQVYSVFPDVHMIAEESTSFSGVTRAVHEGGLGFGIKWMMGWMNDTLSYFKKDPIYRSHHQGEITFSLIYAYSENFMLPLSHDEVVHGKQPLIYKMPGDRWQKFANLRLLYGYMFGHPGSKLLFMGSEFGQTTEWNCQVGLDWHLLQYPEHRGLQSLIKDLNKVYTSSKSLHELSYDPNGFEWIDLSDFQQSIISFLRKSKEEKEVILCICNFTPIPHGEYRIGVPLSGTWNVILNSDAQEYEGSAFASEITSYETEKESYHGKDYSIQVKIPPLAAVYLKFQD